jgi:3-isopropylmalate/(R)-2-methylmalate dehydratase small subunit
MDPFTTLHSRVVLLPIDNVDTDQIIPARYMKGLDKAGLGEYLFADWRTLPDGKPDPDFALHQPGAQEAQILVTGDNFGCGSSREHAPWALKGWGFRAIVSTSFADIFRNNALKNGLLPVQVTAEDYADLLDHLRADPSISVEIDLLLQMVRLPDGRRMSFPIDPFSKRCLLNGHDPLGYTLAFSEQITTYEAQHA